MKTLIQYLLEAAVNTADLENNLKFEKTDIDNILDILDTDEYNHFIELCGERYTKDEVRKGVFLLNHSTHFKIMYEGSLLGIFSVCLPENFKNLLRNNIPGTKRDMSLLKRLFYPFLKAAAIGEPYDIIDKSVYNGLIDDDYPEKIKKYEEKLKEYSEDMLKYRKRMLEYNKKSIELKKEYDKYHDPEIKRQLDDVDYNIHLTGLSLERVNYYKAKCEADAPLDKNGKLVQELAERIMSITGFVVIWQLSKDAKKKIDVNQIALLKIFLTVSSFISIV